MNTYYVHSNGEEFASNVGDLGSILDLPSGRFPWRRERLPTPVFLLREFHGQRSQVGYGPWSRKESDMNEQLTLSLYYMPGLTVYETDEVLSLWRTHPRGGEKQYMC